jgi:hypothetical protein
MSKRQRPFAARFGLSLVLSIGLCAGGASVAHAQSIEGFDTYHRTYPASGCSQAQPGSLSYWAGELANWSSSQTLWVSCPVAIPDSNGWLGYMDAYSAGTYQGVNCTLELEFANRTGFSWGPTTRAYGPGNIYDIQEWPGNRGSGFVTWSDGNQPPAPMMSLECSIEPGAIFEGYDYDTQFTDWQY